jgi:ATP/maltotriose-dependent transcriptional regulator MalT
MTPPPDPSQLSVGLVAEVESTLLSTKLFVPPVRAGLVTRPRLIEKLKAVLTNKLTLVSAPAGFGKTTVLTQWLQDNHISAAWLSLEEPENDHVRFWEYVICSLKTIHPAAGETSLSLLRSSQPAPFESVLTPLINDLSKASDDFVLVLDDYHCIELDAVHKSVAFLTEHVPPKTHLVILTRVDPPLPLARFRAGGTMLELRANDLRFNDDEAVELVAGSSDVDVSCEQVAVLNARAEGWVAGLRMALLSLRGMTDASAFVSKFAGSQKYIMDYLMDEVLSRLAAETRRFLLTTSPLERFSASLCDAVTGRSDSQTMLADLERSNLFVVPLDSSREWYRYHHLFRDLLRHRLRTELAEDQLKDVSIKACRWYEVNGLAEEAVNCALTARDWQRALQLLSIPEVSKPRLRSPQMLKWLQQVPEELLRADPALCLRYIWALEGTGNFDAAEDLLRYLEGFPGQKDDLRASIAVAHGAIVADRGDFNGAEEYLKLAHSLGSPDDAGLAARLAAVALHRGRVLEAEPLMRVAYEGFRNMGNLRLSALQLTYLGVAAQLKGRLHEAARTFQEAIELAGDDSVAADAHLYLGEVHYMWNDLEEAARQERLALALMPFPGTAGGASQDLVYLQLARTAVARGDSADAARALEIADRILLETNATQERRWRSAAFHAAVSLVGGDTDSALRWTRAIDDRFLSPPPNVVLLQCWVIGKALSGPHLEAAYEHSVREAWWGARIAIRICQAVQADTVGEAMELFAQALRMGKPESYVRMFLDFGLTLAPLLRRSIRARIEPEYARRLLDLLTAEERRRKADKGDTSPAPDASMLSEREFEVLRLVADGLSNREIADRLIIGLQTAKTHVRHVFNKLGANGRTQAIARARELGLL